MLAHERERRVEVMRRRVRRRRLLVRGERAQLERVEPRRALPPDEGAERDLIDIARERQLDFEPAPLRASAIRTLGRSGVRLARLARITAAVEKQRAALAVDAQPERGRD